MKRAYQQHKNSAKARGIDFEFTYDEWVAWWMKHLGPDWMKLRGCKRGQYVMARYFDDGPYASHNVKCILVEENHIERNKQLWIRRFEEGWTHTIETKRKITGRPRKMS